MVREVLVEKWSLENPMLLSNSALVHVDVDPYFFHN